MSYLLSRPKTKIYGKILHWFILWRVLCACTRSKCDENAMLENAHTAHGKLYGSRTSRVALSTILASQSSSDLAKRSRIHAYGDWVKAVTGLATIVEWDKQWNQITIDIQMRIIYFRTKKASLQSKILNVVWNNNKSVPLILFFFHKSMLICTSSIFVKNVKVPLQDIIKY